jgi:hypothetical protein
MAVFEQRLSKHVPTEMNTVGHRVFSMWSVPKSYKEENWGNQGVELCKGG